jgi:poly-gamma-glutamate capsule biosynthesis protein CapA/YwtB (metallophosphatase superfamily)
MARRSPALPAALAATLLVVALGGVHPEPDAETAGAAARSSPAVSEFPGRNEARRFDQQAAATARANAQYTAEHPRTFTLVATGDVLLHTALWDQARADAAAAGNPAGHDFGPMLAGVRPLVSGADVAICHMETPVAPPGGPFSSYPSFSVPPEIASALAATGYDACTTASNHTYDRGAEGVKRTLDALDAAGIRHAGSARTPQEAGVTTLLDVDGVRLALLSYTFGFNGIPAPGGQTWRSNPIDERRILTDANTARRRGAEVVVVALHWGDEYNHDPNGQQQALAPRLIRSPDIDLLLGHHAHVVQPIEAIDNEWVVYGMGNLVSNQGSQGPDKLEGLLVRFRFTEQPDRRWRVTNAEFSAVLTDDRGPIRVFDVRRALADPATDPSLRPRLQTAWQRTATIAAARGGPSHGLRPIAE